MKAGDKVWAVTTVVSVEPNGVIYGDWDMHDPACVIPHTDALPAVARWLAAHPDAAEAMTSLVQLATDHVAARWPDDADLHLDLAIGRALLAALTTEGTA
jgi:hypothetical protein